MIVTEDFLTKVTCAFCKNKANDFINTADLDHEVVKIEGLPQKIKDGTHHTAIPICDKHFYKFITHPQIKKTTTTAAQKKKKNKTRK